MSAAHPTLATCGQLAMSVTDSTQIGEARRTATALASKAGFDETRTGEVAIVVTEIASNLLRHGKGGDLVLRVMSSTRETNVATHAHDAGIEVIGMDNGPGIGDVARALRDGFSTGTTPGNGLGAIARLASSWDVFSSPTAGTAIVARLWRDTPPRPGSPGASEDRDGGQMAVGVVSVPYPGESRCGDAWAMHDDPASGRTSILVADGLGHGPSAVTAAETAVRTFKENAARLSEPTALMTAVHAAMRSTRGGAVAIADISRPRRELRFCGVGNISAILQRGDGSTQSLVSQNGTAGAEARRIQQFAYPWEAGRSQLVMHSDGLTTRWQLSQYPGLSFRNPSLIAAVLYRDHRRGRDDASVVVARDRPVRQIANGSGAS